MDPDLDLLERWRGGDARAGEALFARHFADVYRFLEHKCRGECDELVQRTFLACVDARDQFRGQSSFRTYLFTIARHELYRHLRDVRKDDRLDFGVTSIGEIVTSPSSRLARNQEIEWLREALRELPAQQQLLLELHYWHGLDTPALAEVLEVPVVTVRTRLFRARRALRERLAARSGALAGASDRLAVALAEADGPEPKESDPDAGPGT